MPAFAVEDTVNGEFERLLGWVAELGLRGLAGAFLVALPVAALVLVGWLHRLPHLRAYWHVPIVTWPAVAAGTVTGWCLLYAAPYGSGYRIATIFETGGPWDVTWLTFLRLHGDPGRYGLETLLPVIRMPDADPVLALVLLVAAVLLVIAVVGALIYLRGLDLIAAFIGIPFVFLVSQAITIYVTALFAYTFNTLNFWAAAVALVILQYFRRVTNRRDH
ncbi:MAG TPA: hypothetical protein VIR38_11260 [Thalassobaculum sp.]